MVDQPSHMRSEELLYYSDASIKEIVVTAI
jgi:hypothetical protein